MLHHRKRAEPGQDGSLEAARRVHLWSESRLSTFRPHRPPHDVSRGGQSIRGRAFGARPARRPKDDLHELEIASMRCRAGTMRSLFVDPDCSRSPERCQKGHGRAARSPTLRCSSPSTSAFRKPSSSVSTTRLVPRDQRTSLLRRRRPDPNHFDPNDFGPRVKWQLPDLETSEIAYRLAHDEFEAHGRTIVDATVDGKLNVFPEGRLRSHGDGDPEERSSRCGSSTQRQLPGDSTSVSGEYRRHCPREASQSPSKSTID